MAEEIKPKTLRGYTQGQTFNQWVQEAITDLWQWIQYLHFNQEKVMVDISKLQSDIGLLPALQTAITNGFAALNQQIATLQKQIASGGTIQQSDIDALDTAVDTFEANVGNVVNPPQS